MSHLRFNIRLSQHNKYKHCSQHCQELRYMLQVAVEIILGFDESWLADDRLVAAREAFQDWTLALFSVAPLFTRFIPGTSESRTSPAAS